MSKPTPKKSTPETPATPAAPPQKLRRVARTRHHVGWTVIAGMIRAVGADGSPLELKAGDEIDLDVLGQSDVDRLEKEEAIEARWEEEPHGDG